MRQYRILYSKKLDKYKIQCAIKFLGIRLFWKDAWYDSPQIFLSKGDFNFRAQFFDRLEQAERAIATASKHEMEDRIKHKPKKDDWTSI